jgi:protein O-mannosyl-transferase
LSHKNISKIKTGKKAEETYLISEKTEQRWLVIILILSSLIYCNTFSNSFCWDDHVNIVDNNDLRGTAWSDIVKVVSTPYLQMYTPVTNLTYYINYQVSGTGTAFYHFCNLLFHLFTIFLLYKLFRLLSGRMEVAFFASLIFAVHPMNVEAVSWISARSTTLYCIFLISSLIFYVKYLRNGENSALLFSVLFFFFSAMAKSAGVVLPLLLFTVDWLEKRKPSFRMIAEKIPFVAVALFFGWLTVNIRYNTSASDIIYNKYNLIDKFLLVTYSLSHYLIKYVFPSGLCNAFGTPDKINGHLPAEYYFSVLLIPFLLLMVFRTGKYKRLFQFGIAFYIISLLLVLQIVPFGRDLVADRYAYLPYAGICYVVGFLFGDIYNNQFEFLKRSQGSILLVIIVFLFSAISFNRNKVWKDDVALFKDAIEKRPENFFPYYFVGTHYTNFGDPNEAIRYLNTSLELNPLNAEAYNNRAISKAKTGDAVGAITDYTFSLKLSPSNALAYYSRGTLLGGLNRFEEAKKDLDEAIKLKPDFGDAYFNRGMANLSLNNLSMACNDWKQALKLKNEFAQQRLDENCK